MRPEMVRIEHEAAYDKKVAAQEEVRKWEAYLEYLQKLCDHEREDGAFCADCCVELEYAP